MSKTGVTHTDTASGKGGGRLTEKPAAPAPGGGVRPNTGAPATFTGERQAGEEQGSDRAPESPDREG